MPKQMETPLIASRIGQLRVKNHISISLASSAETPFPTDSSNAVSSARLRVSAWFGSLV